MATKEVQCEVKAVELRINLLTGDRSIKWQGDGAKDRSAKNLCTLSDESRLAYFQQIVNDINHSGGVTTLAEFDAELMGNYEESNNETN